MAQARFSAARKILSAWIVLTVTSLACFTNARAEDDISWKTRIPAQMQVGKQGAVAAQFEIACRDGKGGALSWSLIIAQPDALTTFPLTQFEGPDGIGETRKLAEWSVGDAKNAHARTPISGWYGVDGDGFVLATSRLSAKPSELARFSRLLVESDQARLRLRVQSPKADGDALEANATIGEHHKEIARIITSCLAPMK